jgi:hypothetical protein
VPHAAAAPQHQATSPTWRPASDPSTPAIRPHTGPDTPPATSGR